MGSTSGLEKVVLKILNSFQIKNEIDFLHMLNFNCNQVFSYHIFLLHFETPWLITTKWCIIGLPWNLSPFCINFRVDFLQLYIPTEILLMNYWPFETFKKGALGMLSPVNENGQQVHHRKNLYLHGYFIFLHTILFVVVYKTFFVLIF